MNSRLSRVCYSQGDEGDARISKKQNVPLSEASIEDRFRPVREAYQRLTGWQEQHENAVMHHRGKVGWTRQARDDGSARPWSERGGCLKPHTIATFLIACSGATLACTPPPQGDPWRLRSVGCRPRDHRVHREDSGRGQPQPCEQGRSRRLGSDALPLEARSVRAAGAAPAGEPGLAGRLQGALQVSPRGSERRAHGELRGTMQRIAKAQGDKFPAWVLDQVGTEVMLANRVAMGPGLAPPRFRWVSYVDALMLPLSTKAEAAASPDREKLYPSRGKAPAALPVRPQGPKRPGDARRLSEDGGDAHARSSAEGAAASP